MKIVLFVIFAIVLGASAETVEQLIVGGNDAAPGQFPYFVSFRYGAIWQHGCGGGILNRRWILSVRISLSILS